MTKPFRIDILGSKNGKVRPKSSFVSSCRATAMVATVTIELPPVDACGVWRVTNPFAPNVTMVAADLRSRARRIGLRRHLQVKCPVTGLLLEPLGNAVVVNLDKQATAYARSKKVYVRSPAELAIQSVRRTCVITDWTNEKRVPVGKKHNADPFE